MAQGVAWMARELGVPATIVVPDNASMAKLAAVERLGGRIVRVPWERWWAAVEAGSVRGGRGRRGLLRPPRAGRARHGGERDDRLRARGGARGDRRGADPVGRRWADDRGRERPRAVSPETKVYVCEPETGAPVAGAIAAGGFRRPCSSRRRSSTALGRGRSCPRCGSARSRSWTRRSSSRSRRRPRPSGCFSSARIVAEGAAAMPVAAALEGRAGRGRLVCIVSGGNIDGARLRTILAGDVPRVSQPAGSQGVSRGTKRGTFAR